MKTKRTSLVWRAILLAALISPAAARPDSHFTGLPEAADPEKIGNLLTRRFVDSPHPNFGDPKPPGQITYPEVCAWYGALTFSKLAGRKDFTKALVERFEPLFGEEARLLPRPDHVDNNVFGGLASEIFLQAGDRRAGDLGKYYADVQWEPGPIRYHQFGPVTRGRVDQGLSWHTRYWIDDMYMITIVQSQAFRSTGETKYLDRAARSMVAYLDELQEPNGMFHHAKDAPFFWGRGNGWMAAGMAELLRSLPRDHKDRARIHEGYRKMMSTLLSHQGSDGMWRQLVDDPESWAETSCSAMFTFAMITGCKEGWLDADTYGPAARKAWIALTGYVQHDGDVREVCVGTNTASNREHYMKRPRAVGDMHGQAPVLWCATALLRQPSTR
jgi:unsaturated rhamnogalacturonyl hydrolase